MDIALHTADPNPQPDPKQDRFGAPMPARITEIVRIAQVLSAYGRHISSQITKPTLWRAFSTIARFFGTVVVSDIAAHVQRGIMRAQALEAMLLGTVERGGDLIFPAPAQASLRKATPTIQAPRPESPQPNPARTPTRPLTLSNLPTQKQVEAWVRRRPIGRIIAAICLDLGTAPTLCTGPFWNRIFEALQDDRGNLGTVMSEFHRRVEVFEREDWKRGHLPWPQRTREGVHSVLGFFIGEDLPQPALAVPTGPP